MADDIRLIKFADLDKTKWNSCVHYANKGHLYGYWWFLHAVVKEWDALVEGDYETVFPLFKKTIFGRGAGLYQPNLIRETGIYSIHLLSNKRIEKIMKAIPEEYENVDILLNEGVKIPDLLDFNISTVENHLLFLKKNYSEIAASYIPEISQQLKRANEQQLIVTSNIKPEKIAALYQQHTSETNEIDKKFHAYQRIMYNALHRGWGFASGITTAAGEVCAAAFFVYSHGRLLRLVSAVTPVGKTNGAAALLYDMICRSHENRPLILDFNSIAPSLDPTLLGAETVKAYRIQKKKKMLGIF